MAAYYREGHVDNMEIGKPVLINKSVFSNISLYFALLCLMHQVFHEETFDINQRLLLKLK